MEASKVLVELLEAERARRTAATAALASEARMCVYECACV